MKSKRKNYRKIYEQCYGPIPIDIHGRSYEIHHRDGDHINDLPDNLQCISIDEHYQIHHAQEDWGACYAIKLRMKHTANEISILAATREKENWKNGVHNFQRPEIKKKIKLINEKRLADGTHNILTLNSDRIENGTHNFLGSNTQKNKYTKGEHPTQIKLSCIYCKNESSLHAFGRLHGDNCDCNPASTKYKMDIVLPRAVWWNNGHKEKQSKTCPGIDWHRGPLTIKSKSIPPTHYGKKRWHCGDKERVSFESPGPEWSPGGKKKKSDAPRK